MSKGAVIAGVVVYILILLAAVATVTYFYYPREPTVGDPDVQYNYFFLNDSLMSFDATITLAVDNPNYADVEVTKITLDVYHAYTNDDYIGTIVKENIVFPKRKNATHVIDAALSTNDLSVLLNMNTEYLVDGHVTLRFEGPAKIKYLVAHITHDFDFTTEVVPT
mmetsp:Transcript_28326/g.40002  ORF Transcript_28326/g.40002 Transcript_28326/m.40002 type:complete len:165 (-) Transcript_28326:2070-2564(-)